MDIHEFSALDISSIAIISLSYHVLGENLIYSMSVYNNKKNTTIIAIVESAFLVRTYICVHMKVIFPLGSDWSTQSRLVVFNFH